MDGPKDASYKGARGTPLEHLVNTYACDDGAIVILLEHEEWVIVVKGHETFNL